MHFDKQFSQILFNFYEVFRCFRTKKNSFVPIVVRMQCDSAEISEPFFIRMKITGKTVTYPIRITVTGLKVKKALVIV